MVGNDAFADAAALPIGATIDGDNRGATREHGEPVAHCLADEVAGSQETVWYAVDVPETGTLTVDLANETDQVITLWTGSTLAGLDEVGCFDSCCEAVPEQAQILLASGRYYVSIQPWDAEPGPFTVSASFTPGGAAANDEPWAAEVLTPGMQAEGSLQKATRRDDEPECDDFYGPTLWYRFSSDRAQIAEVTASASDAALAVYDADDLVTVGCVEGSFTPERTARVSVEEGEYLVQVGARDYIGLGSVYVDLAFDLTPGPPNDGRGSAESIDGGVPRAGTIATASTAKGDPDVPCGTVAMSVWYRFTAPSSGVMRIDVAATRKGVGGPYLAVAAFEAETLEPISCSNRTWQPGALAVPVGEGQDYLVAVTASYVGADASFAIAAGGVEEAPPNDDLANAIDLGPLPASTASSTAGAAAELDGPDACYDGGSVWYTFTAPATGSASITLTSTDIRPATSSAVGESWPTVALYDISGSVERLGCEVATYGSPAELVRRVHEGRRYAIAVVEQDPAAESTFQLDVAHHESPANDDFADAAEVVLEPGVRQVITGSSRWSTEEPFEPEPVCDPYSSKDGYGSVWYRFRAPSSGAVRFGPTEEGGNNGPVWGSASLKGGDVFVDAGTSVTSDMGVAGVVATDGVRVRINPQLAPNTSMAVFTGDRPHLLTLACDPQHEAGRVGMPVVDGETYHVLVHGDTDGDYELPILFTPTPTNDAMVDAVSVPLVTDESGAARGVIEGDTTGATATGGEERCGADDPLRTVWYAVEVPGPGVLDVRGGWADHAGPSLHDASGKLLDCGYAGGTRVADFIPDRERDLRMRAEITVGEAGRHLIRVTDNDAYPCCADSDGPFQLDLTFTPAVANDSPTSPAPIGTYPLAVGDSAGATLDADERDRCSECVGVVWYQYRPQDTGVLHVAVDRVSHSLSLFELTDDGPVRQDPVTSFVRTDLSGGRAVYLVDGGRTYALSVEVENRFDRGPFELSVASTPRVPGPLVSAGSVSVAEGDAGPRVARVPITLDRRAALPVTVSYSTSDATTEPADRDPASGQVTFMPGETRKYIDVRVLGDHIDEDDEVLEVTLASAGAQVARFGSVTIVDDDEPPVVFVADVSGFEGDEGTTVALFHVRLSAPSEKRVEVGFATADGSAVSGSRPADYLGVSGAVVFEPGAQVASIPVAFVGDRAREHDETFAFRLLDPVNASPGAPTALGTILNDDGIGRRRT